MFLDYKAVSIVFYLDSNFAKPSPFSHHLFSNVFKDCPQLVECFAQREEVLNFYWGKGGSGAQAARDKWTYNFDLRGKITAEPPQTIYPLYKTYYKFLPCVHQLRTL